MIVKFDKEKTTFQKQNYVHIHNLNCCLRPIMKLVIWIKHAIKWFHGKTDQRLKLCGLDQCWIICGNPYNYLLFETFMDFFVGI